MTRDRAGRLGCISLLAAIVSLLCSRAYYAFFFLPKHHGSVLETAKRLIDFGGWWAYVQSVPGIVFHGLAFVSLVVFGACIWMAWRRGAASDSEGRR